MGIDLILDLLTVYAISFPILVGGLIAWHLHRKDLERKRERRG